MCQLFLNKAGEKKPLHSANSNEIMDLGNDEQCLPKPLSED